MANGRNRGPRAPVTRVPARVERVRRMAEQRSPIERVWALVIVGYVVTLTVYLGLLRPHLGELHASSLPWPLISVAFGLSELKVVDVHFRRERHSFSLSEVPMVMGLLCLSPLDFLLALVAGTGAALMVEQRRSRVRRAFNLGNALLGGMVSLALFHALVPVHPEPAGTPMGIALPAPEHWLAAAAAILPGVWGTTIMVALVITASGGAPQLQRLGGMLRFSVMVAITNLSIGLLVVITLALEPVSIVLLSVPIVVIFYAYRAYVSERDKHERLELLYESSRILQHTPELDASIFALVDHARKMFRAEVGQLVIFPDRAAGQALSSTSIHDGPEERMAPIRVDGEPALWRRVREARGAFFWRPSQQAQIGSVALDHVMVSPLTGESGPLGMMLMANPLATGSEFASDDLRLLETVANQVAIALENGQLERSLSELSRLKEELRYQAYHDALTTMPNRLLFAQQVEFRLAERIPGEEPVVMFLDLDDFKNVNDTLGHGVGDRLLVAVADRIRDCVRSSDLCARLGGDEFAILMAAGDGMGEALAIADRLVASLRAPFSLDGQDILIGASVGIAAARPDLERADDLLRNADVAMYTAKSGGKRRVAVFDPLLHAELRVRHELSADLARSLGRGELLVYYQPIIELSTAEITGIEALVRWRHPTRGFVPPDVFVRLAEENGAIEALGAFVLEEACRQTVHWRSRMRPGASLSVNVNVSPRQLKQPAFVTIVEDIIARTGLDPSALVLEMTETGMLEDTQSTTTKLRALQRLGIRIAMDDFGTGYSSLSYLRRFPIDILKIAKDFVGSGDEAGGAADAEDPWAFARAIVALGHSLRLATIAEGVETLAQLHQLQDLGCAYGQGYYFCRPLPHGDLEVELHRAGVLVSDDAPVPAVGHTLRALPAVAL